MSFEPVFDRFHGEVPLFPLPKVVLFPGTKLPLHIFEPRYRQMVADAERDGGWLGMVLLKGEEGDSGDSEIHSMACLGQMRHLQRLPDGRYLLQMVGLKRALIRRELDRGTPYRVAKVDLLTDVVNPLEEISPATFVEDVMDSFNGVLRDLTDLPGNVLSIQKKAPPGLLLDVMSYYLPTDARIKQKLLDEVDFYRRGRLLKEVLEEVKSALPRDGSQRLRIFPKPSRN